MDDKHLVNLMRKPNMGPVLELIIEMANLTIKEEKSIRLCMQKDMTQYEAAEFINRSEDAVQKWYSSGKKKLHAVCDGVWWIEKLAE